MTRVLYGLGHLCARWRFLVLGVWVVLIVAVVVAAGEAGSETTDNVTLPGTGSQDASDLLSGRFPSQAYGSNPLVVATDTGKLTDSKYSNAIASSVSNLKKTAHVNAAVSPLSPGGAAQLSKDKKIGYISVTLDVGQGSLTDGEANAVLDAADPAKKAGLQTAVGGYVGQELSKADSGNSDKIGILAAVIILLLVFGSAVAMGLPIITAVLGLLCGLSVITLLSHVTDVPTTAPTRGDDDRARGRDRLLAVHRHQAPRAGCAGDGGPGSRSPARSPRRAERSCSPAGPSRSRSWRSSSPESRS